MQLAALGLEELLLLFILIVLPLLQKLFSALQKKAREAAAKQRMRQRGDGTLDEPARSASTTDDAQPKRGAFWEWLEQQVGEGPSAEPRKASPPASAGPPRRSAPAPSTAPADVEPDAFWDELVEDPEFPSAPTFGPASGPAPTLAPRPVAPATEQRPTYAQISDFQSTSRGGLGTMSAAPDEGDVESGLLEHEALTEMSGLASASLPAASLAGLSGLGLGSPFALGAGDAPRRARAMRSTAGKGVDWRRAVVLAEVLGKPVSLRGAGGFAPGLDS